MAGRLLRIVFEDGALRAEAAPAASADTLILMSNCLKRVVLQVVGRGSRETTQVHSAPYVAPGSLAIWVGDEDESRVAPPSQTSMAQAISIAHPKWHNPGAVAATAAVTALSAVDRAQDTAPDGKTVWLSDAIDDWRKSASFSGVTWRYAYGPSFRLFREFIGTQRRDRRSSDGTLQPNLLDVDVCQIERQHIAETHPSLCAMPQRQGRRTDKREARALLEQAKAAKLMPMSPANVEKKLRHLLPFLDWCRLKGYLDRTVIEEMDLQLTESRVRVQKSKRPGQKKTYIALSREKLSRVFGSDSFRLGAIRHDWAYWCPLLCLYAGLRIVEASQIMTCDLVCIDNVYCLKVTTTVDENEDVDGDGQENHQMVEATNAAEAERRLKNASSRRTVPLHPKLIELGFLEFVRNMQGADTSSLVFKGLTWPEKSQWSQKPGDHIGDLLRITKVYVKRRKVPHSCQVPVVCRPAY